MKKMSTLYKKDPNDLGRVINEINPENAWVFESGIPTRKYDGTSCAIINGKLYKRYDAKKDKKTGKFKQPPVGSIPCQNPDDKSGHYPHWTPVTENDKYHLEACENDLPDGTYELCGEKVRGNPENIVGHVLIPHGKDVLDITDLSFEGLRQYLEVTDIEGIVFHDRLSDKMCKIRKSDFGIKR